MPANNDFCGPLGLEVCHHRIDLFERIFQGLIEAVVSGPRHFWGCDDKIRSKLVGQLADNGIGFVRAVLAMHQDNAERIVAIALRSSEYEKRESEKKYEPKTPHLESF